MRFSLSLSVEGKECHIEAKETALAIYPPPLKKKFLKYVSLSLSFSFSLSLARARALFSGAGAGVSVAAEA